MRGRRQRGRGRIGRRENEAAARFRRPPTGKQAARTASAQAGLEFNPVIRQMRGEARGSTRRERDIGAWYDQLASDYATGTAQAQDAYKASEAATTQRTQEAGARGVDALKGLSSEDATLAALVGGPKNSQGLSQMAAAQAAADRQRTTLAQPNTEAGANAVAYLGRRASAARLGGIEARSAERRARGKIKSDLATARREKGKATVANMEVLRAGARDYAIQQRAFPLEKSKVALAAREGAIATRQAQERIGISRKNAATSARAQRATAKNYREGDKGLTPTQRRAAHREQKSATITAANLYKAAKKPPKSAAEWAAFAQLVASEEGIDATAAQKAVARLKKALAAKSRGGYKKRKSVVGTVISGDQITK